MRVSIPVLITMLIASAMGTFTGRVTISEPLVQSTNVEYQFVLNFAKEIPRDGRLVIRFPKDFETSFSVRCSLQAGFTTGTTQAQSCAYQSTTRMLTLTGAFPTTSRQLQMKVSGVTNPLAAQETQSFQISSYSYQSAEYVLMETGGTGITITTTPGSLYSPTLDLREPVVGLLTVLTMQFVPQHALPIGAILRLTLPKWNQNDPYTSDYESMIAVATSPGQVECLPQLGLINTTTCIFTHGIDSDTLEIITREAQQVQAGALVSMLVQGVRAPPSQTPVQGFTLVTQTSEGVLIDRADPSQIQMRATRPVSGSGSTVQVSAKPATINDISNVTLIVQNNNPLMAGATVRITVPDDFDMSRGSISVTTSGIGLNPNPVVARDAGSRTLTVQKFNSDYLQQRQFNYFYIYGMGNPGQTRQTSSFKIVFLDQMMKEIEFISSGVTFQATVHQFNSVSMQASTYSINQAEVGFSFTLQPHDSFNSSGKLQLVFPQELQVRAGAYMLPISSNMRQGQVTVQYNRVVTIESAFPQGYSLGDLIEFTLIGVRNPPTTDVTGPISLKLYYEEITSEINVYQGTQLTFKAQPSDQITIDVNLDEMETGQTQTNMTVTGQTPLGMIIVKDSYLRVTIPAQFLINDPARVASSCTALEGFSDEILCRFESVSQRQGSVLIVAQGFQSSFFPGGKFTFSLSGLQNPHTTENTDFFNIEVYDKNRQPLLIPNQQTEYVYVRASDFAFSFVQPGSQTNGASSMYTFSVTFSVDTPPGSILNVILPEDIQFDESKNFKCVGLQGFSDPIQCSKRTQKSIWITLLPSNTGDRLFKNGTTLEFQIGFIKNPVSFKPSKSFSISTFEVSQTNLQTKYFYYSQTSQGLVIANTQRGLITINNITQVGQNSSELGQTCKLLLNFTSQNLIPAGSILTIIVPTNFVVESSELQIRINGELVNGASLNKDTYTITAKIAQAEQQNFTVLIQQGLKNPLQAPYQYSSFNIEFNTDSGWAIDKVYSDDVWINVQCAQGCQLCRKSLDNCVQCGADPQTAVTYYLDGSKCLEKCPAGQYGGPNYKCLPCKAPCIECEFTADLCTVCDPKSRTPFTNQLSLSCYTQCPSGTYGDPQTLRCTPCEYPCYTCSSASKCLSCDVSKTQQLYLHNETCEEQCPPTTIASPSNVCVDCEAPCATCAELPDQCTSCQQGLFLYKNLCVQDCPWQYFKDEADMKCVGVAALRIPMPFSILMMGITIGVGISSCMKHSGNGSTAFFITCLALCDILLRVNWFVVGLIALSEQFQDTFYGCSALLLINMAINLLLWRRFFKYKYNMDENDRAFVTYCKNYPRTSSWLIFLSYLITFQAIRLTYSKALGKKMFMASFTRQKRYYRFIGQLSLIQIFFLYLPAIALMIYSVGWQFSQGDQLFYLGVDSLFLVAYGTVFISVVMCQREKVLNPKELFNWCELCNCCPNSDDEPMYEEDDLAPIKRQQKRVMAVNDFSDHDKVEDDCKQNTKDAEVMSAASFNLIGKAHLYQTEHRQRIKPIKVSIIDYNEYRNLQDKLDRVKLKQTLFENRRDTDYQKVQELSGAIHKEITQKDVLKQMIQKLQNDLVQIQAQINEESRHLDKDLGEIIRQKRNLIAQRSTQSNQPGLFTLNSVQAESSPQNNLFHLDAQRLDTDVKQTISSSGYHNSGSKKPRRSKPPRGSSIELSSRSSKNLKGGIDKQSFGRNNL